MPQRPETHRSHFREQRKFRIGHSLPTPVSAKSFPPDSVNVFEERTKFRTCALVDADVYLFAGRKVTNFQSITMLDFVRNLTQTNLEAR